MVDKRRAKRLPARFFVNIRSLYDRSVIGRGVVVDVSERGLAIESEVELDLGDSYECDVEIPLKLKARVVRRLMPGQMKRYGLELEGQGFIDKILFKKLLEGQKKTFKI